MWACRESNPARISQGAVSREFMSYLGYFSKIFRQFLSELIPFCDGLLTMQYCSTVVTRVLNLLSGATYACESDDLSPKGYLWRVITHKIHEAPSRDLAVMFNRICSFSRHIMDVGDLSHLEIWAIRRQSCPNFTGTFQILILGKYTIFLY